MPTIAQLLIAALIASQAGPLLAAPVTGVGDNVQALAASAAPEGDRLLVLAGRRAPGKDFGPFVEIGVISVAAEGGPGSFTRLPELDGLHAEDFETAFSRGGDLYFTKTIGTAKLRIGKVRNGRFVSVEIVLPPDLSSGDIRVQNLSALDDGGLDIGLRSRGDGVLVTLNPDLSVKAIRPIPKSAEFQAVLRLRAAERFLVGSATNAIGLTGQATDILELRGPDLLPVPGRQEVSGLMSAPLQSPDGARIALSTRTAIPGLVTAHLFEPTLAKVKSLVIVEKPSYPWPAVLLLSNTRLVALHADSGKCYATVADSKDGRLVGRRDMTGQADGRCVAVTGAISGAKLVLVKTFLKEIGAGASASIATQVAPL